MQAMKIVLKNRDDADAFIEDLKVESLIEGLKDSGWNRESVEEAFSNVMDSTKPSFGLLFLTKVLQSIEKKSNEAVSEYWTYWEGTHSHEDFLKKSYSLDLTHLKKIRCVTTTKKSESLVTFLCRKVLASLLLNDFVFNQNKFLVLRENELFPLRVFLHEDAIVSMLKDLGRKAPNMVYDNVDFDLEFFQSIREVFRFISVNARVNIADKFRKSTNFLELIKILGI